MILRPPRSTRTDTLFPYPTLFRSYLNFGSAAGFQGTVGMTPYNMAKEAIRALTRTAAREWGDKRVTVNSLCPVALTESFQSALDQGLAEVAPSPIPRMGDLDKDIVPVALFPVRPEAVNEIGRAAGGERVCQ